MAIMGAGALGSLYGGILTEAGEEIVLIKRSKEHVKTINSRGLRISGVRGDRVVKAKATTDPETVGQVDLIFFMVKSIHTEQASKDCLSIVGHNTTVLTLQNGVDNVERIGSIVGREKVLGGSSTHNAVLVEPGHVYHAMDGITTIGELDGSITNRVRRISKVMKNARMKTEVSNNILGVLWTKLLICVSAITLNGIINLPGAEIVKIPELREVIVKAAQEVINVAAVAGIKLVVDDPISWLLKVEKKHKAGKSSMRQDLERGAKTEVDAFSGFVVRKGQQFDIPTPYNKALLGIIKGLERKSSISLETNSRTSKFPSANRNNTISACS